MKATSKIKILPLFFLFVFIPLSANTFEPEILDLSQTAVINCVSNSDNSLILFNAATNGKWKSKIYAVNPGNEKLYWLFSKIWDNDQYSGSIRSLVYSPFSENFYFYSCWKNNNGLYQVKTKNQKDAYRLKTDYFPFGEGLGYFAVNKCGVWLLKDNYVNNNKYAWPSSILYQIEDKNGSSTFITPVDENELQLMSFYRSENFINENEDKLKHAYDPEYILRCTNFTLLLRDKDNRSWWNYDCVTGKYIKYETFDEAETAALILDAKYEKNNVSKNNHILIFVILLIIISVLCILFLVLLLLTKKDLKNIVVDSFKEKNKTIFEIQEKERAKISRDIHDSVVQDIRAIRLETDNLIVDEASKSKQLKIEDMATDCIIKLRNICYNLNPPELTMHSEKESSEIELISIINSLVQQFTARTHVPCVFKEEENFEYPILDKETTQNIFRVVQEALTNIEKHSYATQASIFIRHEDNTLLIYITDNGIGCNPEELQIKLKTKEHLGLRSMIDRMELAGGSIDFFTSQNDGMEVKISFPIKPAEN